MAITIIIGVLSILAGLWLWLSVVVDRNLKRQIQALADMPCPSCNTPFGTTAARAARDAHTQQCDEARKQRPELRIYFVRSWKVTCLHCGARADFAYERNEVSSGAA